MLRAVWLALLTLGAALALGAHAGPACAGSTTAPEYIVPAQVLDSLRVALAEAQKRSVQSEEWQIRVAIGEIEASELAARRWMPVELPPVDLSAHALPAQLAKLLEKAEQLHRRMRRLHRQHQDVTAGRN